MSAELVLRSLDKLAKSPGLELAVNDQQGAQHIITCRVEKRRFRRRRLTYLIESH